MQSTDIYVHLAALVAGLLLILVAAGSVFWGWMVYDCLRQEPDTQVWLWVLILLSFPGAVLYFVMRKIPRSRAGWPSIVRRWTRRRALWQAISAAKTIGNARQYVELGELLVETGQTARAVQAFDRALEQDPAHVRALWGASQAALRAGRPGDARGYLERLVAAEPQYRSGEAGVRLAAVQMAAGDRAAARRQVEAVLAHWSHPEARVLYARLLMDAGERAMARSQVDAVVDEVNASPPFIQRQNRAWLREAVRLRRRLGRSD
jgi:hypothetical protein